MIQRRFGARFILPFLSMIVAACMSEEDRTFYAAFDAIPIGLSEGDLRARLGSPEGAGKEFRLGQREGFEAQYTAAAASRSRRYLFWHRGVDIVCAVGLDDQDQVAYKACGGT